MPCLHIDGSGNGGDHSNSGSNSSSDGSGNGSSRNNSDEAKAVNGTSDNRNCNSGSNHSSDRSSNRAMVLVVVGSNWSNNVVVTEQQPWRWWGSDCSSGGNRSIIGSSRTCSGGCSGVRAMLL